MANDTPVPLNRIERILRNMIISSAGLSVIAILATFVAGIARVDVNQGVWPVVVVLPLIGLPLAFLLVIVFLAISILRRRRLARDGD